MDNRETMEEELRRNNVRQEELSRRMDATETGLAEIIRRLDELARRRRNHHRDGESESEDSALEANVDPNRRRSNTKGLGIRWLEISVFVGVDAFGWLSKVDRYFTINGIAETEKVAAVLVFFEGEALHWFHWWERNNPNATWALFRREFLSLFEPETLDNPYRALYALKQRGSVAEFRTYFERMAGTLRFADEELLKGAWLNGVRSSIREELMMLPLLNLLEMMKYSLKVERRNSAWLEEGGGPLSRFS